MTKFKKLQTLNSAVYPSSDQLKNATARWIEAFYPNFFVTFNFNRKVYMEKAPGAITRFFNEVQKAIHGPKWYKKANHQIFVAAGMWEHITTNTHLHVSVIATKAEANFMRRQGDAIWRKLQPQGSFHADSIRAVDKSVGYSLKEYITPEHQERLFIYRAPPPPKQESSHEKYWRKRREELKIKPRLHRQSKST